MKRSINRRKMLATTGTAAATWAMFGLQKKAQAAPKGIIHETKVISSCPTFYHGWPTIARRPNDQLLVVCSGGRESHVCPFGRVDLITSDDDGATWSKHRVLLDGPIDDRDAGVLVTAKGTILVTTFTSLAYEPSLAKAEKKKPGTPGAWPKAKLQKWQTARDQLTAEQRKAKLGVWMTRSTDGGKTWSERYDTHVNSPHGPIQLADGRLLYPGKELWQANARIGVCQSTDDGKTWQWLAAIPTRPGDSDQKYHELHGVETVDGKLVVQIRNHNKANSGETLQTESTDGGKTWSVPHSIGVWGIPSHLIRLADNRLLMTYGHRRKPLGNQARVSDDGGKTWSEAMIISGDGVTGDLGYPSSVQLADGSLVSVWYENMKSSPYAVLRQARWTLQE